MKTTQHLLVGAAKACMSRASCAEDAVFAALLLDAAHEIGTARELLSRFLKTENDWLPADSDVDRHPELANLHGLHGDVTHFMHAPHDPANGRDQRRPAPDSSST